MEPCAPGTEDDVPMFTTKRDQEIQRLINQKALLRDGKYRHIFERSYLNGSEHWYCNACECAVMGRVFDHEVGKRHMYNLNANRNVYPERKEDERKEEVVTIEIAPGEPAPPGFEEEAVRQATHIQSSLDGFKAGPLLALEYLLELHDIDRSKEPLYLCVLCDKKGDPRTVMSHLSSYNHISCFLRRHFPKCWRKLAPYMNKSNKKEWQNTMQRVAEAIERQFGRLKPISCEKAMFDNEKERSAILERVMKSKHFTEQAGYSFEEYIIVEKLMTQQTEETPPQKKSPSPPRVLAPNKRLKDAAVKAAATKAVSPQKATNIRNRKDSLSSVSSVSSDQGRPEKPYQDSRRQSSPPRGGSRYQKREEVRFDLRPKYGRYDRKLPYERRGSPIPKRKPSPRRQENPESESDKLLEKKREDLRKIQEFRKLSRAIENDLQRTLQKYEKNPEKHPQYNEEWKKFWNRRYKELQAQGVDVSKYDFKPEWIVFWNRRMVELHSDEVREKKEALRKRLAVPEEVNALRINLINGPGATKVGPNLPVTALADQENDVIVIEDENDPKEGSKSPWEREKPSWNKGRSGSPWRRDSRRSPARSSPTRQLPARRGSPRVRSPPRRGSPRLRSPMRRGSPRRSPMRRASPKRSPPRRVSPRRSPFSSRNYDRPRSRERSRSRSKSKNPSRSRNLSKDKMPYGRSRSRSRNPRSSSLERIKDRRALARESSFERDLKAKEKLAERRLQARESSHDSDIKAKEKHSERRMLVRESSFDRDMAKEPERRLVRESSFERDLKAKERVRTVADLPWEREKAAAFRMGYDPYYDPPMMMRKPMILPEPVMPEEEDDNGEVNVVDVLRILTALEDKLGVLGSKVIDLLAQALAMEKKEANSSESLLDNEINCVLFETVKEKLKGQLQAGLVDAIQERAFKKAIKKIASLVHLAASRTRAKPKAAPPKQNPLSVPGVGAVDKAAIAKQITTALVAQGKTDVTEAELEQLINAVVGMAEARAKNAAKPVTTASFLEQLSGADKSNDTKKTEVVDLDKMTEPLTPSPRRNSPNMDNLSDSDLKTLLQNFKDLSTDEQHNLINYLKKLELREPERVEKLRKFVNLEPGKFAIDSNNFEEQTKTSSSRESPFLDRLGSVNPASNDLIRIESDEEVEDMEEEQQDQLEGRSEQEKPQKIHVDSDDEDYTFEDVVKSVSKNVKDKELQSNMKIIEQSMNFGSSKLKAEVDLTTAKDLISSLMSNISKSNADSSRIDLIAQQHISAPATGTSNVLTNSDFAKTLSNINVSNLTSIVNSVKDLGSSAPKSESTKLPPGKLNIDLDQLNKPSSIYDRFNISTDYPEIVPDSSDRRPLGYDNAPMASEAMPNRENPVYGADQPYRSDQYGYDQDRYRYDPGYGGEQPGYGYNDSVPQTVTYPTYPREAAPSYAPGRGNNYYPERDTAYGADRGGVEYRDAGYAYERDGRYAGQASNQQPRPAFADRGRGAGQYARPAENNAPNNSYYQRGQAEARSNPRYNNYDRYY